MRNGKETDLDLIAAAAHPLISIFAINSNIEIGGNYYEENQSSGLLPVLYTGHDR